jgi:hypothetical protein
MGQRSRGHRISRDRWRFVDWHCHQDFLAFARRRCMKGDASVKAERM